MRGPLAVRLAAGSIPEPNSGCLLWMKGSTAQGRYGAIRDGKRVLPVHRAAWECSKGTIPVGLHVCHKCDVTFCVNPDHLFLGTHEDNMADKARKGRAPMKLSPAQVHQVRALVAAGRSHSSVAVEFNVSRPTISDISRGDRRKYIEGGLS